MSPTNLLPVLLCTLIAGGCDDKKAPKADAKTGAPKDDAKKSDDGKKADDDGKVVDAKKADDGKKTEDAKPTDGPPKKGPELPPMWAYEWHGKLTVDVTTMTDAEGDALVAAIDKDGGDEGELDKLADDLIPAVFRGLDSVTVVDGKGPSPAKVVGFGAQAGPGEIHLKIVLDRPATDKTNALVLTEAPKNSKVVLEPADAAVTPDPEMEKIIKAARPLLADKLPDAKAALKKRPVTTEDIRPIQGNFGPDHFAIYQVAWPYGFDNNEDEQQGSALVLLDEEYKVVSTPYPVTGYVRIDVIHVLDLEGDGIDEIILDEYWMEGLYTKMLRWDPTKKAYETLTLTGDSA